MTNDVLKTTRLGLRLSQEEFAQRLREAGAVSGQPNGASKRLVARWESGKTGAPHPLYARALEAVTGMPIEALGFPARVSSDGAGGHNMASTSDIDAGTALAEATEQTRPADYSGIWLSRYEFYSSSRNETYTGAHFVVLLQTGDRITGRSISPNALDPGSSLTLDLTVDRNVITGTWRERTGQEGFYRGASYHGALQMIAEPTGRRLEGKWLGFGKGNDVNTGPWSLEFVESSTSPAAIERHNSPPDR